MNLTLLIARRYYKAAYQNPYIRFINHASTIGISIGVLALILALSIMNGFERELKNSLLAVIPDIEYESVQGKLDDWQKPWRVLEQQQGVVAAAPYIKLNAMVQRKDDLQAAIIHGAHPILELEVNSTPAFITEGTWIEEQQDAVIGSGLAEKLKLQVGDSIELLIPKTLANGRLGSPQYVKLRLAGIYHMGGQMDQGQVYINLAKLQQVLGWNSTNAEGIKIALDDPFSARYLGRKLGRELDEYVYVLDWFRTNGHIYNDIVMVKDIMYLAMLIVMAVACFNIVSSLTMAVQEKHGDIGILKTMGLKPKRLTQIFVAMGMLTAIKGVVWGVIIGLLLAWKLEWLVAHVEYLTNTKALDADVYFISHIPSEIQFEQVAIIALTALGIAFIASYYPAKKAAKLNPVELISS